MSVYKDKRSQFYTYDFHYKGVRFKETTEVTTKREALKAEKLARIDAKRDFIRGKASKDTPKTLGAAVDRYCAAMGVERCSDMDGILGWLGPNKQLFSLSNNDVDNLVQWKRKQAVLGNEALGKVSPARVNRSTVELLRRIVLRAVKKNDAVVAKMPDWSAHRLEEPEMRERIVTKREHVSILGAIGEEYGALLQFSLMSGLRQKSALLRWKQVDFEERTYEYVGKGGKKSKKRMTPEIEKLLRSLVGHHDEWVFTYVARKRRAGVRVPGQRIPITVTGLKSFWEKLKEDLGIEDLRWHDLRRSAATNVWEITRDLASVQKMLDHSKPETTLKYAMVSLDAVADSMARAEGTFASRAEGVL